MSIVFLFPGQGSQQAGMLSQLPNHREVTQTLEEASTYLHEEVRLLDQDDQLRSTVPVQICLLVAGVATARLLQAEGVFPDVVAGHSVGVFAAAVIAESLDFREALLLVKLRGQAMQDAYPHGYGMGIVAGMTERQLADLIRQQASPDAPVYIANINTCSQMTIVGKIEGIQAVLQAAGLAGARRASMLPVSVPSHCSLLDSVALKLSQCLNKIPLRDPIIPTVGNRKGRLLTRAEQVRDDLAFNVAHPVRWHEATSLLFALGARLFIEMSPGHVLSDLARHSFSNCRSFAALDNDIPTITLLAERERMG